jgi:hypothetical protein
LDEAQGPTSGAIAGRAPLRFDGNNCKERGPLYPLDGEREDTMGRDLWTLAAISIAFGVIVWIVLGHPQNSSLRQESRLRIETSHSLNADPDLRSISERSPYMRTER